MIGVRGMEVEKLLEIAKLLHQRTPLATICQKLRVSGKNVRKAKLLLDNAYITINEQGEPAFTTNLHEAETFLEEYKTIQKNRRGRPTTQPSAEEAVEATYMAEIAREAQKRTSQYLTIGKTVASAYWKWAQKRRIPIEEAVRQNVGTIITDALEKEADYDRVVKENQKLRETVKFYAKRLDPIWRLERGIQLIHRFLELRCCAEALGINLAHTGIAEYYQKQLERFLIGKLEEKT